MEEDSPSDKSQKRRLKTQPLTTNNKQNITNTSTIMEDYSNVLFNRVTESPINKALATRRSVRLQVAAIKKNLINITNTQERNRMGKEV
jgi:hypothetical protein